MYIEKIDYTQIASLRKRFLNDLNKEFVRMRLNEEQLRKKLIEQINNGEI